MRMMNPHSSLTDDVVRGDDVIAPPEVFAADSRSLRALDAQGAGLVSKPASSVRLSLSALALSCLGSAIAGATIAIVGLRRPASRPEGLASWERGHRGPKGSHKDKVGFVVS